MYLFTFYFIVFSIHITCIQSSPYDRTASVQIQNYEGPIFLNPASCCANPCSKSCSILYHVGNGGCETDCNCVSKVTPFSIAPQPFQQSCCCQSNVCCSAPTSGTNCCGTPQYGTACCVQAVPACSQATYIQPGAYYTYYPQTQSCCGYQSCTGC